MEFEMQVFHDYADEIEAHIQQQQMRELQIKRAGVFHFHVRDLWKKRLRFADLLNIRLVCTDTWQIVSKEYVVDQRYLQHFATNSLPRYLIDPRKSFAETERSDFVSYSNPEEVYAFNRAVFDNNISSALSILKNIQSDNKFNFISYVLMFKSHRPFLENISSKLYKKISRIIKENYTSINNHDMLDILKTDSKYKRSIMHWLSHIGELEVLELLFEQEPSMFLKLINQRDVDRYTPLFVAAKAGHLEVVKFLFNKGAHINIQGKFGSTPLFWAVQNSHLDVAKWLLQCGADTNLKCNNNVTVLGLSAHVNQMGMVRLLVEAGANTAIACVQAATVWQDKLEHYCPDVLARLNERLALYSSSTEVSIIPEEIARIMGNQKIFEFLRNIRVTEEQILLPQQMRELPIKKAAFFSRDISQIWRPLLFFNDLLSLRSTCKMARELISIESAMEQRYFQHFRENYLGKYKSDLRKAFFDRERELFSENMSSDTLILSRAILDGRETKVYQLLLQTPVNSILHYLAEALRYRIITHPPSIRLHRTLCDIVIDGLSDANSEFSNTDFYNRNLLHWLSYLGDAETLEQLLSSKPGECAKVINETDRAGDTPLSLAVKNNNGAVVKFLLQFGVELNTTNLEGRTPLFIAVHYGYLKIVEYLLQRKANPNISDDSDATPLMIAAETNQISIIKVLLDARADITIHWQKSFEEWVQHVYASPAYIVKRMKTFLEEQPEDMISVGIDAEHLAEIMGHDEVVQLLRTQRQANQQVLSHRARSSH